VAAKTALNAKNLEALGAARLAELLAEISAGNAAAKRRLRLELAAAQSPGDVAKEVRKRLTTIGGSRSFVDWQGVRSLADDLDTQRRAIAETMAKSAPTEALDLLWRFMALAPTVFDRCDDSSGVVICVFHQACQNLGEVASKAKPDPTGLADRAYEALVENGYGQFDQLIQVLAPALGQTGLEHLKQRMIDLSNRPITKPAESDRVEIGWSSSGPIYADEMAERSRISTVRLALTEIADVQGDVDAFIAQYEEQTRKVPKIAAEIARRLLSAGCLEEAWQAIEAAEHRHRESGWNWPEFEWENARIEVLEALGRQTRRRPRVGPVSSARCRQVTFGHISSGFPISMTSKRRGRRSITRNGSATLCKPYPFWSRGLRWTAPQTWCCNGPTSWMAITTRS
jgi:hypothetical protein